MGDCIILSRDKAQHLPAQMERDCVMIHSTFLLVENASEIYSHLYFYVCKTCFNVAVLIYWNTCSVALVQMKNISLDFQNYSRLENYTFKSAFLVVSIGSRNVRLCGYILSQPSVILTNWKQFSKVIYNLTS